MTSQWPSTLPNGSAQRQAMNSPAAQLDGGGHHHQQQQQRRRRQLRSGDQRRPFTVNEALPYTPFTSVLPFNSDIINSPTVGSGPLAPSIGGLVSREDYDALNWEADNSAQSKRLEGSLEFVQNLLKPEKITNFQFKTAPRSASASDAINPSQSRSLLSGLSSFARMIYDNTAIPFRYPSATSESPTMKLSAGSSLMTSPRVSKKPNVRKHDPPKVVKHNPAVSGANGHPKNLSRIEISLPSLSQVNGTMSSSTSAQHGVDQASAASTHTSHSTQIQPQTVSMADLMVAPPPQLTQQQFAILPPNGLDEVPPSTAPRVLPAEPLPTEIQGPEEVDMLQNASIPTLNQNQLFIELPKADIRKDEYMMVDDTPDAPALSTKKHNRASLGENGYLLDNGLNNQERANSALRDVQKCFQEIFEAENHLREQDSSSVALITYTVDQEPTMTGAAHTRAQKLISRTLELGCFHLIPVEDLMRIQNLSDGALKQAEGLESKVDESWGEVDVGMWLQQLSDVETGLRAARTVLSIMSGGREEKQLYSEDLIQQVLNLFKTVMESIIVPLAELRSTGNTASLFKLLLVQKKTIGTVFTVCQKLFASMSNLITSVDLSDTVVNTLEFASSQLIFVENAHTEKDSVVGVQKFDGLRLVAMDMLCQIFLMNPAQRQGIFDDILTSLEKLPTGKLSARQFKLADGGSIQPVTALLMRLVQASAGKVDNHKKRLQGELLQSLQEDENDGGKMNIRTFRPAETVYAVKTEDYAAIQRSAAIQELAALAKPLLEMAQRHASYVVSFMVKRAQKSTKTGESPYRNLLDLVVEDFTTCLDSPDWPAAELFLRLLMIRMLELIRGEKTAAPAKTMALELLGVMAAAISKLRSHVRKTATSFEGSDADELGRWLADVTPAMLDSKLSSEKILNWLGPYRVVLEYLEERVKSDQHLKSASSYIVTDWAIGLVQAYELQGHFEQADEHAAEFGRTAYRLRNMMDDRRWLTNEYSFKAFAPSHAKLSYYLVLLKSQFCDSFKGIFNILMQSMTTDAATVRSRSLKSINQVLETDPTILDGDSVVIESILKCSEDSSPQVRDSALGLMGKCMGMRPKLEERMTTTIIARFIDSAVGVRKRAMKLARDIYLGNQKKIVRSTIVSGLLHRIQDPDDGVRELARQMVEEVWITPFYKADDSVAYKQSLTEHVALMVQTVKQGNASAMLDKVFQTILSPESKLAGANFQVCTRLVANMFDLVDNPESEDPSIPSGRDTLQVLQIFAKAEPKLFVFEQIRLLQPRIASVGTNEDLSESRSAVVIYRRVLPQISNVHSQFLGDVRSVLMRATSTVTRALLDDVVACLWIISGLLGTNEHLARLLLSSMTALGKIRMMAAKAPLDELKIRKLSRYALITGMIGKHCNLDNHVDVFKQGFPKWKEGSVSSLMIDCLEPFVHPTHSADARKHALDAIGLVCQSNPRNYTTEKVFKAFQHVFDERNPVLEAMILRSFKEFLLIEEKRSEDAASASKGDKEPVKKDLKVMGNTIFDDVASATTQRFLKDITRITLASQDEHAFLAMEVLATINRQGLVHPKETGVTLITLETCPNFKISELAYHEHRVLHEKHETVIEREYVKAVQSAFQYQRDISKDSHGATSNPYTPKLHLLAEVLKISKSKNRQRFLEKLVGQIDFEPTKLEVEEPFPSHVDYVRFLVENLAFFDYVTLAELQSTVAQLEKLVTGTGPGVAQSIEAEVFQLSIDAALGNQHSQEGGQAPPTDVVAQVDSPRLRQLTAASMIMLATWEVRTHLKRTYGLNAKNRETKSKAAVKDLAKAPTKVQGVTGDRFWDDVTHIMTGLESVDRMKETCKSFVELLNVDKEITVGDEEEDADADADGEPHTPEALDEDPQVPASSARGRKRKAQSTPGSRKKRARSGSRGPRGRGRSSDSDDEEHMEFF